MKPADKFNNRCIHYLLSEILIGAAGRTREHWIALIGPVNLIPVAPNVNSNWSVSPIATEDELVAIDKAIGIVRAEHPYVMG